jgi:hypothetical protein
LAASYARHVFNGLDVRYPYIRDLGDTSVLLSLLQYTLLFVALARLLLPYARRALGGIRPKGIVILVSPGITAIPGAVEPRFFLPLQMVAYMLVCFGPGTRRLLLGGTTERRIALGASYALFVLVCLLISSATLAELQHPGAILGA